MWIAYKLDCCVYDAAFPGEVVFGAVFLVGWVYGFCSWFVPPLSFYTRGFLTEVVVFICFMSETKGRSLESIDKAFETSPLQEMINRVSRRRANRAVEVEEEDVGVTQNSGEK